MSISGITLASALLGIAMTCQAACDSTAEADTTGYRKASDRITTLPEFRSWYERVKAKGEKAIFGAHVDKQQFFERKCYWSVSVYSDEGTRLHLWQAFLVPVAGGSILRIDPVTGEPAHLRSNSQLLTDAYQLALRARYSAANPGR